MDEASKQRPDIRLSDDIVDGAGALRVAAIGFAVAFGAVILAAYLLWQASRGDWRGASEPRRGAASLGLIEQSLVNDDASAAHERAVAAALLSSYGWVDKSQNVARLPIEAAVRVMLTRQEAR